MADVTKTIAIQALWDGTKFKAGTLEAAAAVDSLQQEVSASTETMESALGELGAKADAELGTTIPSAADKAVVGLTTRASKFKSVGADLGTELVAGTASGVSASSQVANLGTSLSTLLALSVGSATGIAGALGLGLGVGLIKNMIDGANARKEEFVASVTESFKAIEVNARDSFRDIRKEMIATFDFKALTEELGGGDAGLGLDKLRAGAEQLNVPFEQLAQVLRGDIRPSNRYILDLLKEQADNYHIIGDEIAGPIAKGVTGEQKAAQELLNFADDRIAKLRETGRLVKAEQESMRVNRDLAVDTANAQERTASATERQLAAIENINRRNPNGWALQ